MTRHNAMFRFNFFRRSYVDEDEAGFMFYYGCYIYRGGMCYVCACSLHACVRVLYMRTRTCVCVWVCYPTPSDTASPVRLYPYD